MQGLTDPPRAGLTAAAVTALLKADTLTVTSGLELLDADLSVLTDISDDLEAGKVTRVMLAPIHGTCRLSVSCELVWGVDLVRPYQVLSDGLTTARFNLGVFVLTTPERTVETTPTVYEVSGYDRLYLLDRAVGDTYYVAAGTSYLTAVAQVIDDAGLEGVVLDPAAAAKTLPTGKVWPLLTEGRPSTWLGIVNDLLSAINYRGVYADPDGLYRSEPYVDPDDRAIEFTFDTGSATLIGERRTLTEDVWATPNKWVFLQQNRDQSAGPPTEGDGQITIVNQSDGPTSIDVRGLVWPKVLQVDAADQAALLERATSIVAADRRVTSIATLTTGPFPLAGHNDVYLYDDTAFGAATRVQARQWDLDLAGADTSWKWERIT